MATKQQTPQWGLCIDWETSGATWGGDSSKDYQGLTFGAIVFRTDTFEPVEELYREIKYAPEKGWGWQDTAEKIHGKSRQYLEEHGVDQETAAVELIELIMKYWGTDSKVMLLGHNVEFDRRFTNQLLNQVDFEFSIENTGKYASRIDVHHVMLDTSSTGFIAFNIFKSDLLFNKVGFEDRGNHDALDDARRTLATAQTINALVQAGWEIVNG
jgi:DNA polymerase III epsilon subunit-like protein